MIPSVAQEVRATEVLLRRAEGWTWEDIGHDLDVTRQRARESVSGKLVRERCLRRALLVLEAMRGGGVRSREAVAAIPLPIAKYPPAVPK